VNSYFSSKDLLKEQKAFPHKLFIRTSNVNSLDLEHFQSLSHSASSGKGKYFRTSFSNLVEAGGSAHDYVSHSESEFFLVASSANDLVSAFICGLSPYPPSILSNVVRNAIVLL
jgi:hypothetical protein